MPGTRSGLIKMHEAAVLNWPICFDFLRASSGSRTGKLKLGWSLSNRANPSTLTKSFSALRMARPCCLRTCLSTLMRVSAAVSCICSPCLPCNKGCGTAVLLLWLVLTGHAAMLNQLGTGLSADAAVQHVFSAPDKQGLWLRLDEPLLQLQCWTLCWARALSSVARR